MPGHIMMSWGMAGKKQTLFLSARNWAHFSLRAVLAIAIAMPVLSLRLSRVDGWKVEFAFASAKSGNNGNGGGSGNGNGSGSGNGNGNGSGSGSGNGNG